MLYQELGDRCTEMRGSRSRQMFCGVSSDGVAGAVGIEEYPREVALLQLLLEVRRDFQRGVCKALSLRVEVLPYRLVGVHGGRGCDLVGDQALLDALVEEFTSREAQCNGLTNCALTVFLAAQFGLLLAGSKKALGLPFLGWVDADSCHPLESLFTQCRDRFP